MFCPKCGNQMNDDAAFCSVCGEKQTPPTKPTVPVQQAATQVQPVQYQAAPIQQGEAAAKKKGGKTALVIILIVLIVAALAVGAVLLLPKLFKNDNELPYDHLAFVDGVAIYNGQVVEDGDDIRGDIRFASLSGNCYVTNYGCVIKDGKAYQIKDYGDDMGFCFSVAASGDGVAYYTGKGGINLLDTNTGDITEIEKDGGFRGVVISPDGKTVLYSNGAEAFLYCNGKSKSVMKGESDWLMVVAVADNGEYVHLLDNANGTYYCLNKEGDDIYKRENTDASFSTNYYNTQVILSNRRGTNTKTIYDAVNNKKTEITHSEFKYPYPYFTPVAAHTFCYDYYKDIASIHHPIAKVANYNVEDLHNCYYTGHNGGIIGDSSSIGILEGKKIKKLYEREDVVKLLSDNSFIALDREEYLGSGDLIVYKDGKNEKIASKVMGFGVSLDEKTIYYFTEDEKLMMYRKGKSTELDNGVCVVNYSDRLNYIGVTVPVIVGNDIILYGKNDGKIYMYKDGKKENADALEYKLSNVMAGYAKWAPPLESMWFCYGENSVLFITTPYLPYMEGNDYFVMDAKGNITELDP